MADKPYSVRNIMELLGLQYKPMLDIIQERFPDFNDKAGINAGLSENEFKTICQDNGITIEQEGDEGKLILHKNTSFDLVKVAPNNPVVNKSQSNYNLNIDKEYEDMKAVELTQVKVRKSVNTSITDIPMTLERIAKFKDKYKTKLNDTLLHDTTYLNLLFKEYKYIIIPINIPRGIRERLKPIVTQLLYTELYNNKLIAFNESSVLYVYIN